MATRRVASRRRVPARRSTSPRRSTATPTRRIRNPATGTYYRIRVRSTSSGARGTIIGRWKPTR